MLESEIVITFIFMLLPFYHVHVLGLADLFIESIILSNLESQSSSHCTGAPDRVRLFLPRILDSPNCELIFKMNLHKNTIEGDDMVNYDGWQYSPAVVTS